MRIRYLIFWLIVICTGQLYAQNLLYKIADFFQNPIEYRKPFGITPFELKAGGQLLGANALRFDSTETELEGFDRLFNRYLHNLEVELVKTNLLGLLIPQNFMDFQTGLGFKYKSSLINQGLPEAWSQYAPGTNEQLYFAPRLMEANINQSLAFQWSKHFYNYLQFNAGRAFTSAYRTRTGERFLTQQGWTFSVTAGLKLLTKIDFTFKEAYGIEFQYQIARFDDLKDRHNLSPIKNIDFSSFGISLTFSMISGGNQTQGDIAKALFKKGDYIAAKANFRDFIKNEPTHPRLFKAQWMIDECDALEVYQYADLADHFIDVKDFSKAAHYLEMASKSVDETLLTRIDSSYQEIAGWWQATLDSLILSNAITEAEEFLQKTEPLKLPHTEDLKTLYLSEIYFYRGVVFCDYQIWDKALYFFDLAIQSNPAIRDRVEPYLSKIAYGYIQDANLSVDHKNIELALESLRQATAIRPEILFLTREHIKTLEQGIQYLKEQAAIEKLQNVVAESRQIPLPDGFSPQIGMTRDQIKAELGQPAYTKSLETSGNQTYELWIYQTADTKELFFYFKNGVLSKIEKL